MTKINCILLVDDSEADNLFHQIIIEEAKICKRMMVAENGEEALDYLKKSALEEDVDLYPRADLILLDMNMPRMNGLEFLEAYRELPEQFKSGIIIAMLTTSLNPKDRERALETGAIHDFHNKPLSGEMLSSILDNSG